MKQTYNVVIIGAGAVGSAIAYEFGRKEVSDVLVLEKNKTIPGKNQSSRNGGIIHSGIYYPHEVEPLKASLCVKGNELLYAFCKRFHIPHSKTGKLILAVGKKEEESIRFFYTIGKKNKIKGLRMISGEQARQMEKGVSPDVTLALYVPTCGSVAINAYVSKLYEYSSSLGVVFQKNTRVDEIAPTETGFVLTVTKGKKQHTIRCRSIINAAGLYADEIAKMVNPHNSYEIEGTRGELAQFKSGRRQELSVPRMHLYPPPFCYDSTTKQIVDASPKILMELLKQGKVTKTLGAHVSPMYSKDGISWSLTKYVGVGPVKNMGYGKEDYMTSRHGMDVFVSKMSRYFPHLTTADLSPRTTGIMAVLKGKTDFVIERDTLYPQAIHLIGMDSPAFTASLAIAEYTYELYRRGVVKRLLKPENIQRKLPVSVAMVVCNEEKIIERALKSVSDLTDDIVIIHDGPCNDNTLRIAKKYTRRIFVRNHIGAPEAHRPFSFSKTKYNWILQLDADEYLGKDFRKNIARMIKKDVAGYTVNWIEKNGKKTFINMTKEVLFQKNRVYFIGAPMEYVKPVKGNEKLRHVNVGVINDPKVSNYQSWSNYMKKYRRFRDLQLSMYLKPFRQISVWNYTKKDWDRNTRLKIKHPLLLGVIGMNGKFLFEIIKNVSGLQSSMSIASILHLVWYTTTLYLRLFFIKNGFSFTKWNGYRIFLTAFAKEHQTVHD